MTFQHEPFSDKEVVSSMETHGYNTLRPAITPEDLREQCEGNPILIKLYEQMIKQCKSYAHDVFSMMNEQKIIEEMKSKGEDLEEAMAELRNIDELRHNSHESLMDSINILSRNLAKEEKDISWMREVSSGGRATYAIFALLTFYSLSVSIK
ncbi:MAG: hypothetical protein WCT07_02505 [Candidatus Paceibacterota bacterium]|jgi:hypothetical protein